MRSTAASAVAPDRTRNAPGMLMLQVSHMWASEELSLVAAVSLLLFSRGSSQGLC